MNVIYWPSYIDESFTLEENDSGSIQIRLYNFENLNWIFFISVLSRKKSFHPHQSNIYRKTKVITRCAALKWRILGLDLEWEETKCGKGYKQNSFIFSYSPPRCRNLKF